MKRIVTVLSVAVLLLSWPSLAGEHTKPFKMTLWGTSGIPLGVTLEGNPIGTGLCRGDSNFGKFECTTTGYAIPDVANKRGVIQGSNCPAGSAWEVPFEKIVENHIVRFENGGVLWMYPVVDPNLSYVCFDASFKPTAEVMTWDFEGGSGRFEGADGQATWILTGDPIPMGTCPNSDPNICFVMHAVHPGPFEGHITLQSGKDSGVPVSPETDNQAPVAVITPESQTVVSPEAALDGSKSHDPDGSPITYSWKAMVMAAEIYRAETATPAVQFQAGTGKYTFELTVTDDKGATGTASATVVYLGP